METKICNTCGEEKPLTEFNFRNKQKGVYMAKCKECLHKRKNELYRTRYKERYKERLKRNKNAHREFIRNVIKDLKSCGCLICGEKETCCLDFHHLKDKSFDIGHTLDLKLDTLLKEAEKCVILCANCHRKLHAEIIQIKLKNNGN